jgi:hypothetical protein
MAWRRQLYLEDQPLCERIYRCRWRGHLPTESEPRYVRHSAYLAGILCDRRSRGSDVHIMLALRSRFRQVVVADKELNGADVIGQFLGE